MTDNKPTVPQLTVVPGAMLSHAVRIPPHADLVPSLLQAAEQAMKQSNSKSAFVMTSVGSLSSVTLRMAATDKEAAEHHQEVARKQREKELIEGWHGELKFPGHFLYQSQITPVGNPVTYQEMDIMAYTNPTLYRGAKIAFDPVKYPVGTQLLHKDNPGWKDLKRDLKSAAKTAGYEIMIASTKRSSLAMVCKRRTVYPGLPNGKCQPDPEKNGRAQPRNTFTGRPKDKNQCCTFKFNLGANDSFFFLSCGAGNSVHKYHPKVPPGQSGERVPTTEQAEAEEAEEDQQGPAKKQKVEESLADATSLRIRTFDKHFEIVSLIGTFSGDGGKHLHMSVSDAEGNVIGGHLVGGTVFTTLELVLGTTPGVAFAREVDAKTGYQELVVKPNQGTAVPGAVFPGAVFPGVSFPGAALDM